MELNLIAPHLQYDYVQNFEVDDVEFFPQMIMTSFSPKFPSSHPVRLQTFTPKLARRSLARAPANGASPV